MAEVRDLLIEIGTEELPPASLMALATAFADGVAAGLRNAGVQASSQQVFATPRRLAVLLAGVPEKQADRDVERRGPAVNAAFDADGAPTKAAEGFARSCGVAVEQLQRLETDKGSWLVHSVQQAGLPTAALLEDVVRESLAKLPTPKRMRWGDNDAEFVRPLHWICVVFGNEAVSLEVLGIAADNCTRGHRFHANHSIEITAAANYPDQLLRDGKVIADFSRRREIIAQQVNDSAAALRGTAVADEGLLDEVTALVEWPAAVVGGFEEKYLALPEEVLITTMQSNQKYFPVRDDNGKLLPNFVTIANIESSHPDSVRLGNERVIRPRLADAMFFWDQDRKQSLASMTDRLDTVLFQKQLGTLADKSARVAALAGWVADQLDYERCVAKRAATLAKCDLLTEMVGEFPSLQGVMGEYYARHDGETSEVSAAIREQYLPRYASDTLPTGDIGRALAIAERIDTLVGIFAIGQKPSGVKDPFALRRAALGVLRIIIECELPLDLSSLLERATQSFDSALAAGESVTAVFDFMMERLKAYYADRQVSPQVFEAVLGKRPTKPLDFDLRVRAVQAFEELPEAESLSAANKRIGNILKKSTSDASASIDQQLLSEAPEQVLFERVSEYAARAEPFYAGGDYRAYLQTLAGLREPVDTFFDGVMVMAEDAAVRANRLALLRELSGLFGRVADISHLSNT